MEKPRCGINELVKSKLIFVSRKAIVVFLVLLSSAAIAQPGDPGGDPGSNPVPITGLEILIGIGASLGIKKLFSRDNEK